MKCTIEILNIITQLFPSMTVSEFIKLIEK